MPISSNTPPSNSWSENRRAWLEPLILVAAYALWIGLAQAVFLSFVTYFMMPTNPGFQEIADFYGNHEIVFNAAASILFVLIVRSIRPDPSDRWREIFSKYRLQKRIFPGVIHGATIAAGIVIALVAGGMYRNLGFNSRLDEIIVLTGSVLVRCLAVAVLVFSDEYLFRYRLLRDASFSLPPLQRTLWLSILYVLIKALQFELGWLDLVTLFLLSALLTVRATVEHDFSQSFGLALGLLLVFHPILSLPIFGQEFNGYVLIKYVNVEDQFNFFTRILSGGVGGPLSSFALQLVLLFELSWTLFREKKAL